MQLVSVHLIILNNFIIPSFLYFLRVKLNVTDILSIYLAYI